MNVPGRHFPSLLQAMLEALSSAHFVSIDFELSGIPSSRGQKAENGLSRKPSLQERYKETKEAAERYQILQAGLTIVHEDRERGVYTARPFNMHVCPLIKERLHIDRLFSFSSDAVNFLLGQNFKIEEAFYDGVPYLSRDEEAMAIRAEERRLDPSTIPDIKLDGDHADDIQFLERLRGDIARWKEKKDRPESILIAGDGVFATDSKNKSKTLSRFRRRLVYQLIRGEYPDLVAVGRGPWIELVFRNEEREKRIRENRMEDFRGRVRRQIGLRWVIEGMIGKNIGQLDPKSLIVSASDEPVWINPDRVQRDFDRLRKTLAENRPVIVGHNVFTDLIYLYQTFIGELPEAVEDFQKEVYELFPNVIDTKFVACKLDCDIALSSTLADLDAFVEKKGKFSLELHDAHRRYVEEKAFHEAGYDSYLAARVLIGLASIMNPNRRDSGNSEADMPGSDNSGLPTQREEAGNSKPPSLTDPDHDGESTSRDTGGQAIAVKVKKSKGNKYGLVKRPPIACRNTFELLDPFRRENCVDEDDRVTEHDEDEEHVWPKLENHPEDLMPSWREDFWLEIKNRLQVNGTMEGFCNIGGSD